MSPSKRPVYVKGIFVGNTYRKLCENCRPIMIQSPKILAHILILNCCCSWHEHHVRLLRNWIIRRRKSINITDDLKIDITFPRMFRRNILLLSESIQFVGCMKLLLIAALSDQTPAMSQSKCSLALHDTSTHNVAKCILFSRVAVRLRLPV